MRNERASKENGAAAGNRTPDVLPGKKAFSLLNHSRMESKGPGAFCVTLPARAISTKNKHLLLSCDTNPRFHGGSFGV